MDLVSAVRRKIEKRYCSNCGAPIVVWRITSWKGYNSRTGARRDERLRDVRGCAAWPEKLREDTRRGTSPHWACDYPYVEFGLDFEYERLDPLPADGAGGARPAH